MARHPLDPFPQGPFTRSSLAKFTGLPDDVLSHWTKEGLLRPLNDDAVGAGRPKEFDRIEVQKAEVLSHMRSFGCGVDTLRWMAAIVDRGRVLAGSWFDYDINNVWELSFPIRSYRRFLAGEPVKFFDHEADAYIRARTIEDVLKPHLDGNGWDDDERASRLQNLKNIVAKHHEAIDLHAAEIFSDFSETRILDSRMNSVCLIWPSPLGWEMFSDSDFNMSGLNNAPPAGIILSITRMFRDLWGISNYQLDTSWHDRTVIRQALKERGINPDE